MNLTNIFLALFFLCLAPALAETINHVEPNPIAAAPKVERWQEGSFSEKHFDACLKSLEIKYLNLKNYLEKTLSDQYAGKLQHDEFDRKMDIYGRSARQFALFLSDTAAFAPNGSVLKWNLEAMKKNEFWSPGPSLYDTWGKPKNFDDSVKIRESFHKYNLSIFRRIIAQVQQKLAWDWDATKGKNANVKLSVSELENFCRTIHTNLTDIAISHGDYFTRVAKKEEALESKYRKEKEEARVASYLAKPEHTAPKIDHSAIDALRSEKDAILKDLQERWRLVHSIPELRSDVESLSRHRQNNAYGVTNYDVLEAQGKLTAANWKINDDADFIAVGGEKNGGVSSEVQKKLENLLYKKIVTLESSPEFVRIDKQIISAEAEVLRKATDAHATSIREYKQNVKNYRSQAAEIELKNARMEWEYKKNKIKLRIERLFDADTFLWDKINETFVY